MLPAGQGLDRHRTHGRELDLGLVVQHELAVLEAVADLATQAELLAAPHHRAALEEGAAVAALRLGTAHGRMGVLLELARVALAVGVDGDAAACREIHALIVDHEGCDEDLADPLGEALQMPPRRHPRQQQQEIVAIDRPAPPRRCCAQTR
jgi:hypothetical protein